MQERSDSRDTEQSTTSSPKQPNNLVENRATKVKSKVQLYLGRLLLILLLASSVVAIFSISSSQNRSRNWPWGFWYLVSFFFDQFFVLPLISLFQSMLVFKYMFGNPGRRLIFIVEKLISSDILNALKAKRKLL